MKLIVLFALAAVLGFAHAQESSCNPPLWNTKIEMNWPMAGVFKKSRPKFQLKVFGLHKNGTYAPEKRLKVLVKVHKKHAKAVSIKGFYLTLESDDDNCQPGIFRPSRGPKQDGKPYSTKSCPALISMENGDVKRSRVVMTAPKCGCTTIRAIVMDQENIQYFDEDESEKRHKVLTKQICKN